MCGIAGIVRAPGVRADASDARTMATAIRRRGPDAAGEYARDNVALGHRRLTIIDTSDAANQPMANEDGSVVVVFNGEIYNFAALRPELERCGHRFATRSDSEVIVHGWEEWGPDVVHRLRGMFAFAIHDTRRQQLFLARDRLGKKPLYYAARGDAFLFASEIKAIRALERSLGELDPVALAQYATYGNSLGARTIFQHVRKLPPGHRLLLDTARGAGAFTIDRYWDVRFTPEPEVSPGEWLERLDAALSESVRLRLISDVPLGAFLSGGIDSSLVAAYMRRHADHVKTFTIGFRERSHDESPFAAEVARALGTDHHVEYVEPDALAVLPELVDAYDEPFADSSAIPTYYLCRAARRHVTVALSGDGGDELHVGYPRYARSELIGRAARASTRVGRGVTRRVVERVPRGIKGRAVLERFALTGFELYDHTMGATAANLAMLRPGLRDGGRAADMADDYRAYDDPMLAMQATDVHNYLPEDILVKVDRASMWHSLEVRCPLLDHELVELSARIPPALKARKRLLKQLVYRHVPRELLERRKMGFGIPVGAWFKRQLTPVLDEMVADRASPMWAYFDHAVAADYVELHRRRLRDLEAPLWRLVFFHAWSRRNLA